jgi:nucleoside 2-deoxyribosyltransferase
MKNNWVSLLGEYDIKETEITYNGYEYEDEENTKKISKGNILSDIYFSEGIIKFNVLLEEIEEPYRCQLMLNYSEKNEKETIMVGINSLLKKIINISYYDNKWNGVSTSADKSNIKANTEYSMKIKVVGSEISVYFENVLICEATSPFPIKNSPIGFSMYGKNNITIENLKVDKFKNKAFVVMQFTDEFNTVYTEVIEKVCDEFNVEAIRADEFYNSTPIIQDIIESIKECNLIIADITPDNPNVFFEVGYSFALNKPIILICDKERDKLPFDISSFRTLFYENSISGKTLFEKNLRKYLKQILNYSD